MKLDASNIDKCNIIFYGAQQYFLENVGKIDITVKYLFPDGRLDDTNTIFKKYTILQSIEDIKELDNPFVLIAKGLYKDVERISNILKKNNIIYDYMGNYVSGIIQINYLEAMGIDDYIDRFQNRILLETSGKIGGYLKFQGCLHQKIIIFVLEMLLLKDQAQ